jgi:hypothetical protein
LFSYSVHLPPLSPADADADDKLTPADPREVVPALALGLTGGRQLAKYQAAETMAKIVAERLVEHFSASGFVVMRKPLAGGTSALHYPDGWPQASRPHKATMIAGKTTKTTNARGARNGSITSRRPVALGISRQILPNLSS